MYLVIELLYWVQVTQICFQYNIWVIPKKSQWNSRDMLWLKICLCLWGYEEPWCFSVAKRSLTKCEIISFKPLWSLYSQTYQGIKCEKVFFGLTHDPDQMFHILWLQPQSTVKYKCHSISDDNTESCATMSFYIDHLWVVVHLMKHLITKVFVP